MGRKHTTYFINIYFPNIDTSNLDDIEIFIILEYGFSVNPKSYFYSVTSSIYVSDSEQDVYVVESRLPTVLYTPVYDAFGSLSSIRVYEENLYFPNIYNLYSSIYLENYDYTVTSSNIYAPEINNFYASVNILEIEDNVTASNLFNPNLSGSQEIYIYLLS